MSKKVSDIARNPAFGAKWTGWDDIGPTPWKDETHYFCDPDNPPPNPMTDRNRQEIRTAIEIWCEECDSRTAEEILADIDTMEPLFLEDEMYKLR